MDNRDENHSDEHQPGFTSFSNYTYSTISCKDVQDDPKLLECVETKKISTGGQTRTEENTYRVSKADRFGFGNMPRPSVIERDVPRFSFPGIPSLFSEQVNSIFDEMNQAIPRFFDEFAEFNNSMRQTYNEQMDRFNIRRPRRQTTDPKVGNSVHSLYNDEDLHDCTSARLRIQPR